MTTFVFDTHAILWYLMGSKKLSAQARTAIEQAEAGLAIAIIPAIVLTELLYLNGKFKFVADISDKIAAFRTNGVFQFLPLEVDEVLQYNDPVYASVSEMHDRLLVIAAHRYGATIVTRDRNVGDSNIAKTLW